jgi:hypothetical protein
MYLHCKENNESKGGKCKNENLKRNRAKTKSVFLLSRKEKNCRIPKLPCICLANSQVLHTRNRTSPSLLLSAAPPPPRHRLHRRLRPWEPLHLCHCRCGRNRRRPRRLHDHGDSCSYCRGTYAETCAPSSSSPSHDLPTSFASPRTHYSVGCHTLECLIGVAVLGT